MNILLVLPNSRTYVVQPNLGLGYLATSLRKKGHNICILDMVKEKMKPAHFQLFVKTGRFDAIGFHMFSQDCTSVRILAAIAKKTAPHIITLAGGPHPTGDPIGTLKNFPQIDYLMQGYGEKSLPKLMQYLENRTINDDLLSCIEGLGWRNEKGIAQLNLNDEIIDLDALGFPSWDLQRPDSYPRAPHGGFIRQYPYAPIAITRGCPMSCTFCAGANKRIIKRSIDNVMEELHYLRKDFGVREFLLEDENFTIFRGLCREFCEALLKEDAGFTWNCASGVRLDTLNKDDIKLMERAGCHSVSVGIEFGSERIHVLTKKRLDLKLIREKLKELSSTNMRITGFFLMGIPGETEDDIRATMELSLDLNIHRAQFNNFMPLPGSEIWRQLADKGDLANISFDKFFVHDVPYVPDGLTAKRLKMLQRKAYLRFYLRWNILKNVIKDISSLGLLRHLIFRFFDALK